MEVMPKKKQPVKAEQNPAAVSLGRLGGEATAKRGPDYYRKIAAQRKSFRGGRPSKKSTA
jgi:hypothetical protein